MQLSAGLTVADRFRLERPLGEGGMGAVWLAHHTGLDVPCAVKFIHENAAKDPEVRARFQREAKAAALLRTPHVVQLLDHGEWNGVPYMAMEYLEGEDLAHRLRRCGPLPPRETLAIAVQIGRALTKAHAAGLVHRDLKPSNVFLVRDDDREIAKVLDFGIAKLQETGVDGTTKTGTILGTPFYMSPEQARGAKTVDHRADLWALSVVVFQCLTGRLAFRGDGLGEVFVKIIAEPPPVPSTVASVPPGFDGWWARATARDIAQRFQTAKELTEALAVALGVTGSFGADVVAATPLSVSAASLPAAPPSPSQGGGTIALTPAPATPAPVTPATPQPAPLSAPAFPAALTPLQQSVSVHAPPSPGRRLLPIVAVAAVLGVAGGAALVLLRSPATQAPASARPTAEQLAPAPPPPVAHPPPVAETSAPAPAESAPAPAPSASEHTAHSSAPAVKAGTAKPAAPKAATPAGKAKTDFGF